MKKITGYFFLIAIIFLLQACNDLKQYPTSVLELSEGGDDYTDFSFEDGTTHGFTSIDTSNRAFKGLENSDYRSFMGKKSMRIWCEFRNITDQMAGTITQTPPSAIDLTGRKLTVRIWLPKAAFEAVPDAAYGASFFLKTGVSGEWHQSAWTNLLLGGPGVNGVWNELTINIDDMTKPPPPYGDGSPITTQDQVTGWGIKVGKGDLSPEYTGYIYIDSIDVE